MKIRFVTQNFLRLFFIFFFCFLYLLVAAQIPSDLRNIKASQITDSQLQQYLNQARAQGIDANELEAELLRRGLPSSEMSELKIRIQQLMPAGTNLNKDLPENTENDNKRSIPKSTTAPYNLSTDVLTKRSLIFGAELFSNSNLSFEPDLRMATPKNYVIGPDDELLLNIYGVNISQQKLKVSPEGTVNVRYAGIVDVNGLTIEAASDILKRRLSKYYPALNSGSTKLQLTLANIRGIRITLIGAINKPGTYTLPSLATLYNALYVSGGPAENGSFRKIELIRNNKMIQTADLYDFLLKGDMKSNIRLEDNDVIRVPYANLLITLTGELNKPGIFELQESESLADAIHFAGGFKSKAFRSRITGNRFTGFDKRVIDVSGDSLAFHKPKNGDEYLVDSVINRYQNRVIISGAVFKPGPYALDNGMTLKQLIFKAQGLKEDVYTGRAIVVRTREDYTKEYISVELKQILTGENNGILMKKEDSVHVASIFDLRDTTIVSINGAVRKPGPYRYEDGLSLKSLILKADGFSDNATGKDIEISRRKRDIAINKPGSEIVEIIRVDNDKELSGADTELKPFDIITVKEDPFYKKQISVKISGEVMMPAVYTLQSREERISSLISRAGGLLYTANINGAKLVRKKKEVVDTTEIKRLLESVVQDTLSKTKTEVIAKPTTDVAINLDYILKHPGSGDDITLEESDELIIPRINNTVNVSGEVFKPLDIMYETNKSMKDYISDAGGFTPSGKKNKAFVIYANGRSAKIRKPLGIFKSYPKIYPGSSIFVPEKPKKENQLDIAKAGIFMSAIAAVITAVALIAK
jgi:protein involved in polysaccharide export with SLBB domain